MRALLLVAAASLLIGSLGLEGLNSPGAAADPLEASTADLTTYVGVVDGMRERWVALDANCDPDAVFALLYLITTAKVGDLVSVHHFADNPALVAWDRDFADRYFAAYDAYHAGQPTPEPWRIAFAHADSGKSTVMEDLLLGMSAHVNYDLSFSAYAMGLPQNDLKDEYDRVNDAFWNVPVPVANELYTRYEGAEPRDNDELTLQDQAIVETLISWREAAWANAQALAEAPNELSRSIVAASIEAEAAAIARGIAQNQQDTAASRQAICHAGGHPPLAATNGGKGYGEEWFEPAYDPQKFLICVPTGKGERTIWANLHSWPAHEARGATIGAC